MDLVASAWSARFTRGGKVEERLVGGTGLARALDAGGSRALLSLLTGYDAVELEDGDLAVRVERAGSVAKLVTRWASGEQMAEDLDLTTVAPAGAAAPIEDLAAALHDIGRTIHLRDGRWYDGPPVAGAELVVPAIAPDRLGSPAFRAAHGVRFNYLAGAMAGGIASPELVVAMSRAGYLGFFGAGGLPVEQVEAGIRRIKAELGDAPAGFNLLHNPVEPAVEEATVDLFLANGCTNVDASAYMDLTPAVVRYRLHGIREENGRIVVPNKVTAKVSRPEVAEHFLRPASQRVLDELLARGAITARQAELAKQVPVAEDITAEADSGGHTDRRPLPVLIPLLRRLRDRVAGEAGYAHRPRIGAAGGIGDPWAMAAAFAMGADYVMTGSINQATREAGTSPAVKEMLTQAGFADVTMGPAPDMFEIGAQVQVLGRGTMYAQRASKLYEVYKAYGGIDEIPAADREKLEKQIFQRPLADVWAETESYWQQRDPREVARAQKDGRHKMALAFRWYLGMTSRWARTGEASRKRDFQIWCGPAMGLFNDWVKGSWLEPLSARTVVSVADAMMHAACVATRVNIAAAAGPLPEQAYRVVPTR
jgi:PfaD family protein